MDAVDALWGVSGVVALTLLPVGAVRMLAYRSGEVDHTSQLRLVARLALYSGAVALALFGALSIWFLVRGERPF